MKVEERVEQPARFSVEAARRRALVTCDRRQILVPAGDGHVELVLVGEVDGAHRAARRRGAEAAAWHAVRQPVSMYLGGGVAMLVGVWCVCSGGHRHTHM